MKLKTLVVTIAVLAALSVGVFFLTRTEAPPSTDARIGQSLVARDALEKAAKLRIADAGKTVELVRQQDGAWRVPSYYDMPADFSKLSGFAGNLSDAKVQRFVTANAERISRLEFKDTKIELLDTADKPIVSITLGKNNETGGRFFRYGEEQKAYLTSLSAYLDTEPKNWANAELLSIKADDIAKLELPLAEGGPVVVSRAKKDEPWKADKTPTGQQVKADKIAAVLSSLGSIRFTESTALDDANFAAAKANQRSYKITTFDNKTYSVALGRKPEEKKLKPVEAKPAAALTDLSDLTKKDGAEKKDDKPLAPEFETIPAGPVFAVITSSDSAAPINGLMQKRAFQISDYTFTSLPQKAEELFEAAPAPAGEPKKQ